MIYGMLIGMLDMVGRVAVNSRSEFEKERQWTCPISIRWRNNGRRF